MSIFNKKTKSEDLIPVIRNSGDAGLLIWKYPDENIPVNSFLEVMPGERAIFIKNGEIQQEFGDGTYQLTAEKYSFIRRLINKITGKTQLFNCVVYFVNAADTRELKWGTDAPIQVRDKVYGIRTEVKSRGAYKIRICDPALFLKRLVGSNVNYRDNDAFDDWFAEEFQGKIKSEISKFLNDLDRELIGIDEYCDDIADKIKPKFNDIVSKYGLYCVSFSIAALTVDIRKYDIIDQSQLESVATIKKAQGNRGAMDILGAGWDKQQSADMLRDLVKNPTAAAGIGVSMAANGLFGNIGGAPQTVTNNTVHARSSTDESVERLAKLKKLYEAGLIDEADYNAKKSEILGQI